MVIPAVALRFFASRWFKIGLGVLALIALVISIRGGISAVRQWNIETYNNGFRSGSDQMEKQWRNAEKLAALQQRDQIVEEVKRSNISVRAYLADIAARQPQIIRLKERTTVYEKSDAGNSICLDPDGVQLVQEYRSALGLTDTAPSPAPGAIR